VPAPSTAGGVAIVWRRSNSSMRPRLIGPAREGGAFRLGRHRNEAPASNSAKSAGTGALQLRRSPVAGVIERQGFAACSALAFEGSPSLASSRGCALGWDEAGRRRLIAAIGIAQMR